jgi:hypothetical protein
MQMESIRNMSMADVLPMLLLAGGCKKAESRQPPPVIAPAFCMVDHGNISFTDRQHVYYLCSVSSSFVHELCRSFFRSRNMAVHAGLTEVYKGDNPIVE